MSKSRWTINRTWAAMVGLGLLAQGLGFAGSTVAISLNATTGTLNASQAQLFTATVSGTTNAGVIWSLSPALGSLEGTESNRRLPRGTVGSPVVIRNAAVYTAPATIISARTVTITATSAADPTIAASAVISLMPAAAPVSVSLSMAGNTPTSALNPSQTLGLTAIVTGSTNTAVTWSLNPALGSLATNGNSAVYTAPANISSAQTVTIAVASTADPTKTASVTLSLVSPAPPLVPPAPPVTPVAPVSVPVSVTLTMSGNTTNGKLTLSQTQSLTATVAGSSNTAVTWSLNPATGSLAANGASAVYTAPAAISSPQTVTITATSTADPTKSASAAISLVPPTPITGSSSTPVSVSINPTTVTLNSSQLQSFTATVTGSTNTAVTWSLNPATGSLVANGASAVYTAPSTTPTAQTVTITATSTADPTKTAVAAISLAPDAPPISVSLSPATGTLNPGGVLNITATVAGTTNTVVTWSRSPNVGSLATSGNTAVYTAPAIISPAQMVTITATSVANPTKTASTLVSLLPLITLALAPASAALPASGTQQFSTTVTGTANTAVNWSLTPAIGTISPTGLYTAPASVTAPQTVTVIAQTVATPAVSAQSTVSVVLTLPPPPHVQFTVNSSHLTSLSYNGRDYYYDVPAVVQGAYFTTPGGASITTGWTTPTTETQSAGSSSFRQVYNQGGANQFTVSVAYSAYDSRTLQAVASITNNDPTNTLAGISLHLIGVTLPGAANQYNNNIPIEANQSNGLPVGFLSGNWGSVAMWQSGYPTPSDMLAYYQSASQTQFDITMSTRYQYGPNNYGISLAPGQTATMTQLVRFGASTDTVTSLAPDAYAAYRAAFPDVVNWPDRRPIAYWMVADGTKSSTTNPRGYLSDPTINITQSSVFQTRVLASAQSTINILNTMSVKPQGIIIWDIEGEEFYQPFTYVGYPNNLPSLAPEMDTVADQLFQKFTSAGYRVGVTIRPNHFLVGNQLPSTCAANTNYDLSDKFINLGAAFPYRGYICSATNTWSVAGYRMPTAQVSIQDYNQVLSLLSQKISYAKSRWGATLFYIDSTVWEGGTALDPSIFSKLAAQFPDCLLIPEEYNSLTYSGAAPYLQASQSKYLMGTSQPAHDLYPGAFSVVNIANADWLTNWNTLVQSVLSGDILMFEGWWNAPENTIVQQLYSAAGH